MAQMDLAYGLIVVAINIHRAHHLHIQLIVNVMHLIMNVQQMESIVLH